jgi:HK97 family phage major capsid protein
MDEVKVGARNNAKDKQRLQMIHDYSVENGADCGAVEKSVNIDNTFINFGGEIKSLGETPEGIRVGGNLVTFGDETNADPTVYHDFFTAKTNYGLKDGERKRVDIYFHHGQPLKARRRNISDVTIREPVGEGEIWKSDTGILIDAIIWNREEWQKAIAGEVKNLGWSSGALGHLVDREPRANGTHWVKSWVIGEASVTPTPAEKREQNMVVSLKSLLSVDNATPATVASETPAEATGQAQAIADGGAVKTDKGVSQMDNEKFELSKDELQKIVGDAAANAVKAYRESEPPINSAGITVTHDEADRALEGNPFKGIGDFAMAVKTANQYPTQTDQRLFPLKATGLNEAIPSQGGYLVPPQVAAGIIEPMYETGTLLSLFNPQPIQGNSMTFNVVDESSRADGSRWGGLQGYWLNEGGTKTASKPAFRQVEVKLNKVAALSVATDELLEDATALGAWIQRTVPQELRFKVEDAFINGNGIGKPLGIMNSGALKASAVHHGATTSIVDAVDIGTMWSYRAIEYKDYVWLVNPRMFSNLLNLTIGQMPVFIPQGSMTNLPYGTLLGRPIYETEYNAALASQGDIMLISPSAYLSVQKAGGVQAASSIHLYFTTDEQAFRFVYRVGGQPAWSSTRTEKDGQTVSPFVVMTATT